MRWWWTPSHSARWCADQPEGDLPAWAARTLHPVTASRVAAGSPPPDEHRRITTVFLSIPATGTAELEAFVVAATDLVTRMGGDVLQCTGGDKGILLIAAFGVPVAHPDDAGRAVHAVERLRGTTDVPFAAGVSTGLAFTAAFGGETRRFASVLGDSTNLAARLMAAAAAGTTLIDAATAAGCTVELGARRTSLVKNRTEPVEVVEVLGLLPAAEFTADGETPLVGRGAELAAAERLLDSDGGALHLVGDAGTGKSRLAAEIARRAEVRGIPARAGRFEAFGGGRPLGPFLAMVDTAAIAAVRPGDEALAPLIDHTLPDTPVTATLSGEERSQLARRLIADLLLARPGLLVVEDMHWADDESLLLLADLESTSMRLVTTSRADPGLGTTFVLDDLSPGELRTVALDTWGRLGGVDLPPTYLDALVERAAGSPLFAQTVTELVRRSYRPGLPLPDVPLPDQLLPFLTSRLDALGDGAQATALRMAVLGRPVRTAGLAEVFALNPEDVERDLALLVGSGIARPSAGGYATLRHDSVRRALLGRTSHADRAPLHALVCRYLVDTGAPARDVAAHLEHCDLPEFEPGIYRSARDEARSAWLLKEAHHWAELALTEQADLFALAELEQQLGRYDDAEERLRGLEDAEAERLLGRIAFETGRPARGRRTSAGRRAGGLLGRRTSSGRWSWRCATSASSARHGHGPRPRWPPRIPAGDWTRSRISAWWKRGTATSSGRPRPWRKPAPSPLSWATHSGSPSSPATSRASGTRASASPSRRCCWRRPPPWPSGSARSGWWRWRLATLPSCGSPAATWTAPPARPWPASTPRSPEGTWASRWTPSRRRSTWPRSAATASWPAAGGASTRCSRSGWADPTTARSRGSGTPR